MKVSTVEIAAIRSYVMALPAFTAGGLGVPHASVPSPVYVQEDAIRTKAPDILNSIARSLTNGTLASRNDAVELLGIVFDEIWAGKLPDLPEAKAVDATDAVKDSRAKWDRIVSARFTIDTAKLTGESLAVFLSGPQAITAEIKKKIESAKKRNPGADLSKIELYYTTSKIWVSLTGFMLEAFSWVESAGYLTPAG